jgi:hypothetical protein
MSWMFGAISYLPYLVCSCVLGGIAVAGYRRTQLTGPLLIAIACGVRVVHECFGIYNMFRLWTHTSVEDYGRYATMYGAFNSAGALIADVLFIVGVALLLRRVAPAHAGVAVNAPRRLQP